jgi:chorismate dehydratase
MRGGRIVYTNDLPIYCAFDREALAFPGTLHADVPARLNAMILAGELDLGPVSAAHFAQHAEQYVLLPDVCIGSRNDVWSVVLVSPIPPQKLGGRTIAVTSQSASGRGLLEVLLKRRWGVEATFKPAASALEAAMSGEPALLIGDEAIDARLTVPFWHVYDLGRVWHEWTGHDMVYAVWVARRDTYARRRAEVEACVNALRAAQAWGSEHMDLVIADAQAIRPRATDFYRAYYETLNLTLDERARDGLRRFCEELATAGAIAAVPHLEPEVVGVAR